jgi:signal transduction histidine kinase
MSDKLPLYVLAPPGPSRDSLLASVGNDASPIETTSFLEGWASLPAGLVLVDVRSMAPGEILDVLRPVSTAAYGWIIALVEYGGRAPTVRVLSLSPGDTLGRALQAAQDPAGSPGALMELQRILGEVARIRHDLNNPLTSALAEVQLALMDTEGPEHTEIRESLEAVQTQIRRIRDLIASTGHLRPTKV